MRKMILCLRYSLWTIEGKLIVPHFLAASWTPRLKTLAELCEDMPVQARFAEVMAASQLYWLDLVVST